MCKNVNLQIVRVRQELMGVVVHEYKRQDYRVCPEKGDFILIKVGWSVAGCSSDIYSGTSAPAEIGL